MILPFEFTVKFILPIHSISLMRLQARTETEIASERAWLDAEKIWLNHLEGFSAGRLIKKNAQSQDASTCLVKLDHGGEVIEIDEEQISKVQLFFYSIVSALFWYTHSLSVPTFLTCSLVVAFFMGRTTPLPSKKAYLLDFSITTSIGIIYGHQSSW